MEKLSNYQKLSLKFYLAHKDKNLTMADMYIFNAKLYAGIVILSVVVTASYYFLGGTEAASIVGALFFGVLLRDFGTFRRSIRNWPLLQEIIDWEKAASMMKNAD